MQATLLFMLPHLIYATPIPSLRYSGTHSCATITASLLPFLNSLCPFHLQFPSFPTLFPQFPNLSLYFSFYYICFYVLQHKLKSFHLIDSVLCRNTEVFYLDKNGERNKYYLLEEFKRYFAPCISQRNARLLVLHPGY